jgi:hypothetical protein
VHNSGLNNTEAVTLSAALQVFSVVEFEVAELAEPAAVDLLLHFVFEFQQAIL